MPPAPSADPRELPPAAAEQHSPDLVDVRLTDPESGLPWAAWLDARGAQRYIRTVYGLEIALQTLAHKRSRRIGIRWKFYGQKPVTTPREIDRHFREEAFRDESPLAWRAPPKKAGQSA